MTFMKAYLTQIFIGTIMSLSNGDITLLIELNMTKEMKQVQWVVHGVLIGRDGKHV